LIFKNIKNTANLSLVVFPIFENLIVNFLPEKKLIVIVGPTAVGKTAISLKLAEILKTEIISADSRQFYREMEIGTAKPNAGELRQVTHHFINSLSIQDDYSVGDYEKDAPG
jgi:tRNA dimethylallyltransferase